MNLELALALAEQGIYVFPCVGEGPNPKQPCRGVGWKALSTTDPRVIAAWWAKFPNAAPAIDCGKSGLIAVDCDRKLADGLAWIREQGIDPDLAPGSITPSGGRHLVYRNTIGAGNGRGSLPGKEIADIDIRGDGGFILAPGAVFVEGGSYQPIGRLEDAPPLPALLAEMLQSVRHDLNGEVFEPLSFTVHSEPVSDIRKHHYGQTAMAELERDLAGAPEGNRNNEAARIAFKVGQLVGGGCIDVGEAYGRLETAALSWGIGARDKALGARGTIWRAIQAGMGEPRGPTEERSAVVINLRGGGARPEPEPEGEPELEPEPLDAYRGDWTQPAGLMGEMVDWILATSRRPNRPMAVAASVSVMSAVCGRWLYAPTGTALGVYITCLAGTSVGKDRPLSAPEEILTAAGLGHLHASGKVFSVSAFQQMMVEKPCCLATIDEIGDALLAKMFHKRASSHEAGLRPELMTLWTREDGKGPYATHRHAVHTKGKGEPTMVNIPRPNLSIFSVSTYEAFYAALGSVSVRDGFLNRWLLCEAAAIGGAQNVPKGKRVVPRSIAGRLKAIPPVPAGNLAEVLSVFDLKVDIEGAVRWMEWDDSVQARAEAFEEEMLAMIEANPIRAPLLGRTYEYAVRLASLHAISRGGPWAMVTMADLDWGIAWSSQSTRSLIKGAEMYMADGENQAIAKAIKRVLDGQGWITRSVLIRALGHKYKARDLEDVLGQLDEAREIQIDKINTTAKGGRPGFRYRLV